MSSPPSLSRSRGVLTTFLVNRYWVFREHVREGAGQLAPPER